MIVTGPEKCQQRTSYEGEKTTSRQQSHTHIRHFQISQQQPVHTRLCPKPKCQKYKRDKRS